VHALSTLLFLLARQTLFISLKPKSKPNPQVHTCRDSRSSHPVSMNFFKRGHAWETSGRSLALVRFCDVQSRRRLTLLRCSDCGKGAMGPTGFGFTVNDDSERRNSCWGWMSSGSKKPVLSGKSSGNSSPTGRSRGVIFDSCCLVAEGALSGQGAAKFGNWDPECCTSLQLWYESRSPSAGSPLPASRDQDGIPISKSGGSKKSSLMTRKSVTSATHVVRTFFDCRQHFIHILADWSTSTTMQ
jgi:hypothetical protein